MIPILYIAVPTYVLMTCIGLAAALFFVFRRREKMQLGLKVFGAYVGVCSVFALMMSKLLFAIAMIPSMEQATMNEFIYNLVNGGIVFYGGLFGVILGIAVVSKRRNVDVAEMLDFTAPAFPLFHAFARLGCLFAGCCYGVPWNWGVILADEPDVVRFPVQFMESMCDWFIFAGLLLRERKKKCSDNNFALYLCSYAVCRFILEFFRDDEVRGIWAGGFSTSQFISVLILFCCIVGLGVRKYKNKHCK